MMNQHGNEIQNQGDLGGNYPSFLFNHLVQQPLTSQRMQAAFQQRDHLSLVRDHQRNDSLLAAAAQQQLLASLSSPGMPLQFGGQPGLSGDLSRRTAQGSIFQGLSCASSGLGFYPLPCGPKMDVNGDSASGSGRVTTTQIPCQARGMSTDHNSLTAYFEIPSDASHGQHLYCSHPTCRTAGVKFRYCFFCKKPVTKQNFRSRHLHADLDKSKDASKTSSKKKNTDKAEPAVCHSIESNPDVLDEEEDSEEEDEVLTTPVPKYGDAKTFGASTPMSLKRKSLEDLPVSEPRDDSMSLDVISRRRRWSTLLQKRPQDLQRLSAWLSKVIAVSDMARSWTMTESSLSDGTVCYASSVELQSRWNALFGERPSSDESGDKYTAWLVQLLEVSCPSTAVANGEQTSSKNIVEANMATSSAAPAEIEDEESSAKRRKI